MHEIAGGEIVGTLGHSVMQDEDDGPENMNNIKRNENPIRRALKEPERTEHWAMLGRLLIILPFLVTITGCDRGPSASLTEGCADELHSLEDPTKAASKAVESGDFRLVAVKEYAQWTPGAPDPRLRERHGVIVLEKTSDTPADESCERYQVAATTYAESYNRRVLELAAARSLNEMRAISAEQEGANKIRDSN